MSTDYDVVIIGAGFAGCSSAYFLSQSGMSVVLIDSGSVASGGSGNERAHMIPYITSPEFAAHSFFNRGFIFTASLFQTLQKEGRLPSLLKTKALQFPVNDRPKRILHQLETFSFDINKDFEDIFSFQTIGVYKETYIVNPKTFCHALVEASGAKFITHSKVEGIQKKVSGEFSVSAGTQTISTKNIILANASAVSELIPSIQLKKVQGQVCLGTINDTLEKISHPLCFNGYYIPPHKDELALLGATYARDHFSDTPTEENNFKMIENLSLLFSKEKQLEIKKNFLPVRSRIAFRAVSKDRLPLIGKIDDGLFINAGHGSRGLHSAPIGSALLSTLICKNQAHFLLKEQVNTFLDLLNPLRISLNNKK